MLVLVGLVSFVFLAVAWYYLVDVPAFEASCHAKGGEPLLLARDRLCISQDGRIIFE